MDTVVGKDQLLMRSSRGRATNWGRSSAEKRHAISIKSSLRGGSNEDGAPVQEKKRRKRILGLFALPPIGLPLALPALVLPSLSTVLEAFRFLLDGIGFVFISGSAASLFLWICIGTTDPFEDLSNQVFSQFNVYETMPAPSNPIEAIVFAIVMIPVQIIMSIIAATVYIAVITMVFTGILAIGFVGAGILQGVAIASLSKFGLGWAVQPFLDVAGIAGIIWGVLNRHIFTGTRGGGQQATVTIVDSIKDNKPPPPLPPPPSAK
eukprot:CAMPEP_0181303702 /NCGR_PEP_ID=MMETSP1101-20121128/8711_1 /TAXON_ID=46948 /ORGANISM="Rhodomonas abbreviata, Strain Caron Lab Isolate" /LENGTH=263 /DNA_ID=CAMNT_0023409317 /DNA_START=500 /DNA_END=1291 /DNA_ORIENTATION=+